MLNSPDMTAVLTGLLSLCTILALVAVFGASAMFRYRRQNRELHSRYSRVTDVETALKELAAEHARESSALQSKRDQLASQYEQALTTYAALKREVEALESNAADISYGLYKPHFNFETSQEYRQRLLDARERQKALIRLGAATNCDVEWKVGDSRREGQRLVTQTSQLAIRAFNAECDAAIASTSWNNVERLDQRIMQSREGIKHLTGVLQVTIKPEYLALKLEELDLVADYEHKRYTEREEQRRIREQIREEERAQRELESAKVAAESDEHRYAAALEKARAEATAAVGSKLDKLTERIAGFEAKLDEARARKEKAIARAQLTRSGFVYVISNIGSFGDGVFKIGMTRRLEPMDRVYELSGASVPFPFDLHAMLWSDDAPALEFSLHQQFADRRLNLVNVRREFYRDLHLSEIQAFVRQRGLSAQFMDVPEAREFRMTEARRRASLPQAASEESRFAQHFPVDLFA